MATITLSAALSEINTPNAVFSIAYRKDDGSYGEKSECVLRNTYDIGERKKMNRSGLLKLRQAKTGKEFDVTIDLLMQVNGKKITRL